VEKVAATPASSDRNKDVYACCATVKVPGVGETADVRLIDWEHPEKTLWVAEK
jgi:hypothetical protein